MKLLPISALFDAVEPRIVGEALVGMQEACSGTNLRKLREHAKLTQADLASKAGITQSALSLLESGTNNRPTAGTAFALWCALTVGTFGGNGEPTLRQAEILGCVEEWQRPMM